MTPQTITITTARGETFTMNFDGPVSVEVKDAHLSPFEVGRAHQNVVHGNRVVEGVNDGIGPYIHRGQENPNKFYIGDTVEWTDKRLGKKSGVVTDIIGHALKIGPHVTIWDHNARKVTPSTASKFKVGDVVYWGETIKYYGRVTSAGDKKVCFERLTTFDNALAPVGGIGFEYEDRLYHDYRTVAGGGWRKCEAGKVYKTKLGGRHVMGFDTHNLEGYSTVFGYADLIEELP